MGERIYYVLKDRKGDTLIFNSYREIPAEILRDEELALLSKEELEKIISEKTIELERARMAALNIAQDLEEAQELYRTIIDAASDAKEGFALVQDVDGIQAKHVFVNDYYCALTGYTRDELYKMSVFDLVPKKMREEVRERYMRKMRGEDPSGYTELELMRKDVYPASQGAEDGSYWNLDWRSCTRFQQSPCSHSGICRPCDDEDWGRRTCVWVSKGDTPCFY
ncbi:MAG: PAS domain S-box protein, partial [Candidatus Syntropharchaeia archaeon]